MIPVAFDLDVAPTVFLVLLFVVVVWVGVSLYRTDRKEKAYYGLTRLRDDLLLLDPTLVELAPETVHRGYRDEYRTLDIHEVKRLADLQRDQDKQERNYEDLTEAKKRLKSAREEQ